MVPDRLGFAFAHGQQFGPLAQKTPQTTVDEAGLVLRCFVLLGGFHGLVDQRVFGVHRFIDFRRQGQRHAQQRIGFGRRWPARQLLAQRFGAAQPAQRMKA